MITNNECQGPLDGVTILRFAHVFEAGGGLEQHLEDLDRTLLSRSTMRIIRMYLASENSLLTEKSEYIGRGLLIRVPLPMKKSADHEWGRHYESAGTRLSDIFRNFVIYNPLLWSLLFRNYLINMKIGSKVGEAVAAGAKAAHLIRSYSINLAVLHFMGGADSDEIIEKLRSFKIPLAVQNHYSNDRFLHMSIRKHAMLADAVAGINQIGVPRYLSERFTNLSNGIDMNLFRVEGATIVGQGNSAPTILLPARVVKSKGHLDLIKALELLRHKSIDFQVKFAGRVDSPQFEYELRQEIAERRMNDNISFLGVLSQQQLRDLYAASKVVVLPTYHHEGLARVIIEAQAMKVPPVAYATGGVPEGMIPDRTGFLLKTGDINGLANRMEQLLLDNALRVRMGEAGRRFVEEKFSLDALAGRHEAFYLSTISFAKSNRSPAKIFAASAFGRDNRRIL